MTTLNLTKTRLLNRATALPPNLQSIVNERVSAQGKTYLDIAGQFNKNAETYDVGVQKVGWKGPKIAIETAQSLATDSFFQKPRNVLDFGTGTGEVGERLKSLNFETQVTGIDVAKNMLEVAEEKGRIDRAFVGDEDCDGVDAFEHFSDEEFDAIFACGVFDFVRQSDRLINEFVRVSKSGGIIAFTYEPTGTELTNNHGIMSLRHDPHVLAKQFINACKANNADPYILAEIATPNIYTTWGRLPRSVKNNIFVATLSR